MPEGTPSAWAIYFGVDDTDAALERVVELGGTVTQPAQDTPYGRLAQAADPTGASFKLMASEGGGGGCVAGGRWGGEVRGQGGAY